MQISDQKRDGTGMKKKSKEGRTTSEALGTKGEKGRGKTLLLVLFISTLR
jgi:hypothetical protein